MSLSSLSSDDDDNPAALRHSISRGAAARQISLGDMPPIQASPRPLVDDESRFPPAPPSRRAASFALPPIQRPSQQNYASLHQNHHSDPTMGSSMYGGGGGVNPFGELDDEQLMEQWRFMALHEAKQRVKRIYEEYEESFGTKPGFVTPTSIDNRRILSSATNRSRLPDPRKFMTTSTTPKPEEPPMPSPSLNKRNPYYMKARIPELRKGESHRHGAPLLRNEKIVSCIGCKGDLRVPNSAALVTCPDCKTMSPATSIRR